MGRKPIPGIEEKIVLAAIAIGGSHDSNVAFSTKEIAARVGVSEFTVFDRFVNRQGLIRACLKQITNDFLLEVWPVTKRPETTFETLIKKADSYFFAHPEETIFTCNYSPLALQSRDDPALYETVFLAVKGQVQIFKKYLDFGNDDLTASAWTSILRRILFRDRFVLSGLAKNDPYYQESSYQMLGEGFRSAFKEKIKS